MLSKSHTGRGSRRFPLGGGSATFVDVKQTEEEEEQPVLFPAIKIKQSISQYISNNNSVLLIITKCNST